MCVSTIPHTRMHTGRHVHVHTLETAYSWVARFLLSVCEEAAFLTQCQLLCGSWVRLGRVICALKEVL